MRTIRLTSGHVAALAAAQELNSFRRPHAVP